MGARLFRVKPIVTAGLLTVLFSLPAAAQQAVTPSPMTPSLDDLFAQLQQSEVDSSAVAGQILDLWSRSGSASIDLLAERGEAALEAGDLEAALGFFSALVDHAPDFAAGYVARAKAYRFAGLTGPALADLQSALALEPRQIEAMVLLASMLEELGSKDEALAAWQLLAQLTPHDETVKEAVLRLNSGPSGTIL